MKATAKQQSIIERRRELEFNTGKQISDVTLEFHDKRFSHIGKMKPIETAIDFYYIKRAIENKAAYELKRIQQDCDHLFGKWGYSDDGVNFDLVPIRKCRCCGLVEKQEIKK